MVDFLIYLIALWAVYKVLRIAIEFAWDIYQESKELKESRKKQELVKDYMRRKP